MAGWWSALRRGRHRIAAGLLAASLGCAPFPALPHGGMASTPGSALPAFHHTAFTPREGAPAQVSSLAQTADGWLWLGTTTGLYRFDGITFERIDAIDGVVRTLLARPGGGLWIGYSRGGASLLQDGRLTHYDEADGLPPATLHEFALDRKGRLWAAVQNGLFRFDGKRWQPEQLTTGAVSDQVTSVLADHAGTVWVRAGETIFAMPEDATAFRRVARFSASDTWIYLASSPDGGVWASASTSGLLRLSLDATLPAEPAAARKGGGTGPLRFDREGRLWVVRPGGIELALPSALPQLAGAGRQVFEAGQGLSGEIGYALIEDREGNLWLGSEGGLDRFRRSKVQAVTFPGSGYAAMAAGDRGEMVAGSTRMGRVVDGGLREFPQEPDSVLVCAYRDSQGRVWMGGVGEIWRIAGGAADRVAVPAAMVGHLVQAMVEDAAGGLWISVRSGASRVYRLAGDAWSTWQGPPELRTVAPTVMAADSDRRPWLGYTNNRIVVPGDGDAARVLSTADGLQVGDLMAIHRHGDRMWVGGSRGVALFENGRFRPLRGSPGVAIRGVSGIVATAAGELWMNGSDGITRIPKQELDRFLRDPDHEPRFERFDAQDGLEGVAPQARPLPTAIEGSDGKLWFSSSRRLYWLDPVHLERNPMAPPALIRSIQVDGKTFDVANGMTLPQRTDSLAIAYTALSLSVPTRVRFRYRLEGIDTDWRDAGHRRQAFYTHLEPGSYRFRVIAANEDGVWNEVDTSLAFSIAPTFVETIWFQLLCAGLALVGLQKLYLWQMRRAQWRMLDKLQERIAERERIARELHDTLLQSVSGLTLRIHAAALQIAHQDPVRQVIESTLDRADQVLAEGRDRVRNLRTSIDPQKGLREALADAGREFGQDHRCSFRVIGETASRDLRAEVCDEVYWIAREALHNAFRHAHARKIEVRLAFTPRELRVRVRDDGRGIDPRFLGDSGRPGHWGLPGMKERARKIGGRLEIRSDSERGTKLELRMPARLAYADASDGSWLAMARSVVGMRKAERLDDSA